MFFCYSSCSAFIFLLFLIGKNRHGIGKKVAIFDWEWGQYSVLREGQKIPWDNIIIRFSPDVAH